MCVYADHIAASFPRRRQYAGLQHVGFGIWMRRVLYLLYSRTQRTESPWRQASNSARIR